MGHIGWPSKNPRDYQTGRDRRTRRPVDARRARVEDALVRASAHGTAVHHVRVRIVGHPGADRVWSFSLPVN